MPAYCALLQAVDGTNSNDADLENKLLNLQDDAEMITASVPSSCFNLTNTVIGAGVSSPSIVLA